VTEKDLYRVLSEVIRDNYIVLTDTMVVKVNAFHERFKNADSVNYDDLMRIEKDKKYGYEKYLKQWKEQGILS